MYARNFRRREVSQRKKDGSSLSPGADHGRDMKPDFMPLMKPPPSYIHPASPNSNGAPVGTSNASDFCNELLTAASIIESQNSSVRSKY